MTLTSLFSVVRLASCAAPRTVQRARPGSCSGMSDAANDGGGGRSTLIGGSAVASGSAMVAPDELPPQPQRRQSKGGAKQRDPRHRCPSQGCHIVGGRSTANAFLPSNLRTMYDAANAATGASGARLRGRRDRWLQAPPCARSQRRRRGRVTTRPNAPVDRACPATGCPPDDAGPAARRRRARRPRRGRAGHPVRPRRARRLEPLDRREPDRRDAALPGPVVGRRSRRAWPPRSRPPPTR